LSKVPGFTGRFDFKTSDTTLFGRSISRAVLEKKAMSSWVAPSVAAELWGVSIDHIMAGVANGSIPSYVDGYFLFVDITGQGQMPDSNRSESSKHITDAEFAALTFQPCDAHEPDPDEPAIDKEDSSGDISDWRIAREKSARTRIPPNSQAA
jgi:hypothetical protein